MKVLQCLLQCLFAPVVTGKIKEYQYEEKENITLVGMLGQEKYLVGVVLAKIAGYHFLDSDLLIQQKTGKLLHELIEIHGREGFLEIEGEINASIDTKCTRSPRVVVLSMKKMPCSI